MVWACLPVYFVHQCEEYVWPGGFMEMLSQRFSGTSGANPAVPVLSPRSAYWINVGIIWVLFPASVVAAMTVSPAWGLWVPCFTVLNGMSHVVAAIQDRRYNPGLAASLALNIPVGTAAIIVLAGAGIGSAAAWAASILIAIGFMALIAGYAVYRSRNPARR
ncbi:MAG: HXXEE domain-containing protein [Methanoregula sp.]|nr:HXXEE domain-containing protein [Methanoregula sp.]